MVTLKDLAIELGVNVSTVSRALNGSGGISEDMVQKVRSKAEERGYSLRRRGGLGRSDLNAAGIVVPEVSSEYYARLVHLAKNKLKEEGYSSIVIVSDFRTADTIEAIHIFGKIHVKCLLIVMDTEEDMSEEILRSLRRINLPIMLITPKYYPLLEFDCIHLDEYSGIIMGIQHLKDRGYQRIGCIGDRLSANRVTIFRQALKLLEMGYDPKLVFIGSERAERGGYLRTKEALSQRNRPDAIFCCYDQIAVGAICAIEEYQLHIPDEIAVLGFDDLSVSTYLAGGITTIANASEEMISIAVNVLAKRIRNTESVPQQIALRPKLVIRSTT
ncbi:MAG: LacI family DNA-binding transcriptional regulator [Christensenella sp.]